LKVIVSNCHKKITLSQTLVNSVIVRHQPRKLDSLYLLNRNYSLKALHII